MTLKPDEIKSRFDAIAEHAKVKKAIAALPGVSEAANLLKPVVDMAIEMCGPKAVVAVLVSMLSAFIMLIPDKEARRLIGEAIARAVTAADEAEARGEGGEAKP